VAVLIAKVISQNGQLLLALGFFLQFGFWILCVAKHFPNLVSCMHSVGEVVARNFFLLILLRVQPQAVVCTYVLWNFTCVVGVRSCRLWRYWLKGPKAGTSDIFVENLPGIPDNLGRNERGEFWVPLHSLHTSMDIYIGGVPWIRQAIGRLPLAQKQLLKLFTPKPHAVVLRYSSEGKLLEILEDQTGQKVHSLSDAQEHDGKLYLGSLIASQLGIFTISSST
jgi:hypothetical protein